MCCSSLRLSPGQPASAIAGKRKRKSGLRCDHTTPDGGGTRAPDELVPPADSRPQVAARRKSTAQSRRMAFGGLGALGLWGSGALGPASVPAGRANENVHAMHVLLLVRHVLATNQQRRRQCVPVPNLPQIRWNRCGFIRASGATGAC